MPGDEERQIYVGDEAFIYHTYLGLYSKSEPYRMPQVTLLQRELVCSATTFQQYLPRLFMGQSCFLDVFSMLHVLQHEHTSVVKC